MRRTNHENITRQVNLFLRYGHPQLAFWVSLQPIISRTIAMAAIVAGAYKADAASLLKFLG